MQVLARLTPHLQERRIEEYEQFGCVEDIVHLKNLSSLLKGIRVTHINSTYFGGGVAENLSSLIPLLRGLNIDASWQALQAPRPFFEVTKSFHNALQGMRLNLDQRKAEIYLHHNQANAELLDLTSDVVVVHDPQPLPLIDSRREGQMWVWRCHIDPTGADPTVWASLHPYIVRYDALVFTLSGYVKEDLAGSRIYVYPPAIDPLSDKNKPITYKQTVEVLERLGIRQDTPLITQVSRFDPWKDPLGVVDIFRYVKKRVPDVQLALVGSSATDDPEGEEWLKKTVDHASSDGDIHIFNNLTDLEVNAIQRASSVVVQNSIREGFGITVSEALWKRTPVVARRVGGIPLQIVDGVTGFLCESPEQMAERLVYLIRKPDEAERLGEAGHEYVRRNFLITTQLKNELRLLAQLRGLDMSSMLKVSGGGFE